MLSYKFAEFTLNTAQRRLYQNGVEIELRNRDFDVLLLLLERSPQILSKDEIIKSVWNGLIVEDNSVERSLVNIRKILGDGAAKPRFIKTIRGKGYLFVGEIEEAESQPFQKATLIKSIHNRSFSRWILPTLTLFIFFGIFSLIWWKGVDFYQKLTTRTVFYDDFSGKEIDSGKWIFRGSSVRLSDGIAKISVEQVDNGGKLQSVYFTAEPLKSLTITSKIKVSYNQSVQSNLNFIGVFGFAVENDEANFYGIKYANAEGEFCYPGNIVKAEGFYLVKNDGDVRQNRHHVEGKIGPQVEPVWVKWFEQKLIYQPESETLSYFIDGVKKGEFLIGKLPPGDEKRLRLEIYPQGWWLHHSLEIDKIEITQ